MGEYAGYAEGRVYKEFGRRQAYDFDRFKQGPGGYRILSEESNKESGHGRPHTGDAVGDPARRFCSSSGRSSCLS